MSRRRREYVVVVLLGTIAAAGSVGLALAVNVGSSQQRWPGWVDILRREPWWSIAVLLLITVVVSAVLLQREHRRPEPATRDDVAEAANRLQQSIDHVDATVTVATDQMDGLPPYPRELITRSSADVRVAIWKVVAPFAADATDPAALAREWATAPPAALGDLPAVGRLVVAELLVAHGQLAAAIEQFREAVRLGAAPRAFWLVRMAQVTWSAEGEQSTNAEDLLDEAGRADPEYPLLKGLRLFRSGQAPEAVDTLAGWSSHTPWEQDASLTVSSAALLQLDRLDDAIIALEADCADTRNPALLVCLAQVLSARSAAGGGDSRWRDAFRAIELALRARNLRRSWRGDSAGAVVTAGEAAIVGDAAEQVWSITRPPPDGEATEREANDPRVLPIAAMGAALTGRVDQARELVAHAPEGFARKRIEAELASHPAVDNHVPAADAWLETYQAATTDQEKLHALRGLAMEGALDRVALDELRIRHPSAIAEIEANAEVMSIAGPHVDVRLRELEARNPLASLRRADLIRVSDPQRAVDILVDATARWNDPRLLLMAIDCYVDAGDWARAGDLASQAIANVGTLWPGRATILRRIVDIQTALMDWPKVATACRDLLELDPHDNDARWSLAHAQFRDGEPQEAWKTVIRANLGEDASTPQRAIFLMELVRRHAAATQVAHTALAMLRSFPDNHDVHAAAIHTVTMRIDQTELPADLGAQVSQAQASFFTRYPDSTALTAYRVRDDGHPLADMAPDLRQQANTYQETLATIREKTLPVGVLDRVVGKPYASLFSHRPLGYHHAVFSQDQDIAVEAEIARVALTNTCLIDASALYTLTLISEHARTLVSLAQRPTITDVALRDLLAAEDLYTIPSVGTLAFDTATDEVVAIRNDPDDTQRQQRQIQAMLTTARGFRRVVHPVLRHLPPLRKEHEPVWLLTLDAAKHLDGAVWADDIGLRQLAHSLGVKTFGTQSVLNLAREQQLLGDAQMDHIHHVLVRECVVDLPFEPRSLLAVAAEQRWEPRSVATILSRAASWVNAEPAVTVFRTAFRYSPSQMLTSWAHAALHGLQAASTPPHGNKNLGGLIATVLTDRTTRPDQASAIITALGILTAQETDPITHAALHRTWKYLKAVHSIENAATVFLYLISKLDERHRQYAVQLILQQDDPPQSP